MNNIYKTRRHFLKITVLTLFVFITTSNLPLSKRNNKKILNSINKIERDKIISYYKKKSN